MELVDTLLLLSWVIATFYLVDMALGPTGDQDENLERIQGKRPPDDQGEPLQDRSSQNFKDRRRN